MTLPDPKSIPPHVYMAALYRVRKDLKAEIRTGVRQGRRKDGSLIRRLVAAGVTKSRTKAGALIDLEALIDKLEHPEKNH